MSTVGEADRRVGECGAQADEWHVNRLLARYEYDPYGRMTSQAGFYAAANPFRWSTKRFDPETGSPQRISPQAELSDFGMRYYSATLGRWLNRDPIGDFAGANVYAYVGNNPTNFTDYLGLASASCRPGEPCHSGLSSGGGGDPWSPEPTVVEEGDRRPCPHGNRDRGELGTYLPPVSIEQLIAMLERDRLERQRLAVFLSEYEGYWFDSSDLLRLWFEAYKAIHNRHNARFREIFQHFVDAWAAAYMQALAADPYSFSSSWVHGVAREGWRLVHDDETLAGMSDTRIVLEAGGVSVVLGSAVGYAVTSWTGTTLVYRAVQGSELADIGAANAFRTVAGQEVKYFALNLESPMLHRLGARMAKYTPSWSVEHQQLCCPILSLLTGMS